MSIQKTIRLSEDSVAVIESVCIGDVNFSGAINNVIERYRCIMESSLPQLSKYEKLALCQVFNGYWYELNNPLIHVIKRFDSQVSDSIQYDGSVVSSLIQESVDDNGDITKEEQDDIVRNFYAKVCSWSNSEKAAVFHAVNEFWKNGTDDGIFNWHNE